MYIFQKICKYLPFTSKNIRKKKICQQFLFKDLFKVPKMGKTNFFQILSSFLAFKYTKEQVVFKM